MSADKLSVIRAYKVVHQFKLNLLTNRFEKWFGCLTTVRWVTMDDFSLYTDEEQLNRIFHLIWSRIIVCWSNAWSTYVNLIKDLSLRREARSSSTTDTAASSRVEKKNHLFLAFHISSHLTRNSIVWKTFSYQNSVKEVQKQKMHFYYSKLLVC